ncbi:MAG: phosphopyruvate hydratase [Fuerstiella sp.]|nr:phosphopyruvate hydratase [Fuerstiella sp.]MCP4853036.1 phosphopyruvate hydratase [Fuerstiella sp.]
MSTIHNLQAIEILDSRGRPTLEVTCELAGGARASAQVPSGASTGQAEAMELRDGDPGRHSGMGCRKAVLSVSVPIANALRGQTAKQSDVDNTLIALDGTANKARLGANAILGVSIAVARASALQRGVPFYRYLAEMIGHSPKSLPRMTINLFSGGKHAGGQVPVQDVLLVPASATTIDQGLTMVCAVYKAAAAAMMDNHSARLLTADEGGLAPPFADVEAMLDDTVAAIAAAGLRPGDDMSIAMDIAASHFYDDGRYLIGTEKCTAPEMIERIERWVRDYPIVSVEDPLAENDWKHWPAMRAALGDLAITVGDDLLCTNPARIQRAIDTNSCNALLLKVNQIGTLTEAAESLRLARTAQWSVTISARSGETEDNWLADLAVGWGADQIKVGSVTQSERLAKYNRLMTIEEESRLPVVNWPQSR